VTNGYLDDVQVPHIRQWEREFLDFLEAEHGDVLGAIRTKRALDDSTTQGLKAAIAAFKALFNPAD
jgi:F-type H+-transporting ATPase subunit alpha